MTTTRTLTALAEPFDSFWDMPERDVEGGYRKFAQFYRANYLKRFPQDRAARVLVIGCGPGYLVQVLNQQGYANVLGLDSDPNKVRHAQARGLNCRVQEAFPFLQQTREQFDLVVLESEINHLTKPEIVEFLRLCRGRLAQGGMMAVHSLNGANPLTGMMSYAQNVDHYNVLTDYSLTQLLRLAGFDGIRIVPLNSYVFYLNPLNYVAWALAGAFQLAVRCGYLLYAKPQQALTKKIAAFATNGRAA